MLDSMQDDDESRMRTTGQGSLVNGDSLGFLAWVLLAFFLVPAY